jgi:hypothetical protein
LAGTVARPTRNLRVEHIVGSATVPTLKAPGDLSSLLTYSFVAPGPQILQNCILINKG